MLTIKSPISITCSPIMTQNYKAFEERLSGNYQMMQTSIEATDFLHLVSAPPEIYLGEGGMTQLLESTNVYNMQDVKFDLINNMINRIVLMEEGTLTYQDQVFISNMLRKIGISNVEQFIKQVKVLKEEAVNTEELINLYWSHSDEIREISELYQQEQTKGEAKDAEEEAVSETAIHLHQEILNRLQTAAIYQEIKNFNTDFRRQDSYITSEELQISEQSMLAQNMLLNMLQNETYMEAEPLVYEHINAYEYADDEEELTSPERITNKLVEATLLNVVDRIITTRLPQVINHNETWFSVSNVIHQVAGDTIERFKHYHSQENYRLDTMIKYTEEMTNNLVNEVVGVKQVVSSVQENEWFTNRMEVNNSEIINYDTDEYIDESEVEINETVRIQNELNRINQQNIQMQQKVKNILEKDVLAPTKTANAEKIRREALKALNNPQEAIIQFHQNVNQTEQTLESISQEFYDVLPTETREVFKILSEYRKNPQKVIEQGRVQENADSLLLGDIVRQKNIVEREKEIENEVIEFVHKTQEHQIDEEVLEEIINQNRLNQQRTSEINQIESVEHVHETHTQTTTIEQINTQADDIARMVQQGVQSQIGNLSDQVYQRLEKRLSNERMRRGR